MPRIVRLGHIVRLHHAIWSNGGYMKASEVVPRMQNYVRKHGKNGSLERVMKQLRYSLYSVLDRMDSAPQSARERT